MKKKKIFIKIILVVVFALIVYYFYLPPINCHDINFWLYMFLIFVFYKGISFLNYSIDNIKTFIINSKLLIIAIRN